MLAAWLELTYFYGLGALIVFLGATALGRLSLRSVRDVGCAQRADAIAEPAAATPATELALEPPDQTARRCRGVAGATGYGAGAIGTSSASRSVAEVTYRR